MPGARAPDERSDSTAAARAGAGEEHAFRELTDPYRRELQVHRYRMLGSLTDAEDMLQETLLAAWRGLAGFEERSSLRCGRVRSRNVPWPGVSPTRTSPLTPAASRAACGR